MSILIFGLIKSNLSPETSACMKSAALRWNLSIQIRDNLGNAEFIHRILVEQGDKPNPTAHPFLISDKPGGNVSQGLLELYGRTPEEWQRMTDKLKDNLTRVAGWTKDALDCPGAQQIIIYFTDGYDIKYNAFEVNVSALAEFCFDKITAGRGDIPSIGLAHVQWALCVKMFQAASNDSGLT